jgi:hypothetical protein
MIRKLGGPRPSGSLQGVHHARAVNFVTALLHPDDGCGATQLDGCGDWWAVSDKNVRRNAANMTSLTVQAIPWLHR